MLKESEFVRAGYQIHEKEAELHSRVPLFLKKRMTVHLVRVQCRINHTVLALIVYAVLVGVNGKIIYLRAPFHSNPRGVQIAVQ